MEGKRRSRSLSIERKAVKRRRGSSSSSSSLASYYNDESWTNRSSSQDIGYVSNWKRPDLESFGIFYDTKNMSLSDIFSLVDKRSNDKIKDLPEITQLMIRLTKDHFKLSLKNCGIFEANNATEQDIKQVEESSSQLNFDINEEVKNAAKLILDKADNSTGIFYKWYLNLKRFHSFDLKRFLWRLYNDYHVKEIDFQLLFMKFTEIFLMEPLPGDCCKRNIKINGEDIKCVADIRYERPHSTKGFVVVLVKEIKKHIKKLVVKDEKAKDDDEEDENCVINSLSDDILGQVGSELLFESPSSCFCPGVIGILCCGTKVIFLYCEIAPKHWKSIFKKGKPSEEGDRSTIHFTKAYDYMKAEERNEIIQYLFWLGYVQSSNYEIFL